jgi:hypothetical protein
MSNASQQRCRQSRGEKADESAAQAEPASDCCRAGDPRGHPQQLEEELALARRGGNGIREEPDGWGTADRFEVVLETARLNTNGNSAYCRESQG